MPQMSNRAAKPIKAGIGMLLMLDILKVSHVRGVSSGSRNHYNTAGMFGEQCDWAKMKKAAFIE